MKWDRDGQMIINVIFGVTLTLLFVFSKCKTGYLSMNITINEQYPPNSFCIIEHYKRIGF